MALSVFVLNYGTINFFVLYLILELTENFCLENNTKLEYLELARLTLV